MKKKNEEEKKRTKCAWIWIPAPSLLCSMTLGKLHTLFKPQFPCLWASLVAQTGKNLPAMRETWVQSLDWEDPWVRKIPWRREWLPTLVLLPGESHGQRSLVGSSPWGHKESDTTDKHVPQFTWCSEIWLDTILTKIQISSPPNETEIKRFVTCSY